MESHMKNKAVVSSAVMAISLAAAGFAFGEDGNRNDRGHDKQMDRSNQGDHRDNQKHRPDQHGRDDYRKDKRDDGRRDERGAGPDHAFRRGDRLPPYYRGRQYVVNDWRAHRLSPPPRGYQWVQTGGDYVLVSIGSGVILQLYLGG
jgi:Ni/Co efflux regulator RcnB